MTDQAPFLPQTLDLFILKAVSLGPFNGYRVLLRLVAARIWALASQPAGI